MPKFNVPIALLGILWWYLETSYFGWNAFPNSVAELFADGLALAFYASAFALPQRRTIINIKTYSRGE